MSDERESIEPPPALVLGCNTPHGIGVLSDWIEERTGHAPDFTTPNWPIATFTIEAVGAGIGYEYGDRCGGGSGNQSGRIDGSGTGQGNGVWGASGNDGNGDGVTTFYAYGNNMGDGRGDGAGTGLDENYYEDDEGDEGD